MVAGNQGIIAHMADNIIGICGKLPYALVPGCLAIAPHYRQAVTNAGTAPARRSIQRNHKANLLCKAHQLPHMCLSLFAPVAAHMTVLIFQLYPNHRTAILIEHSLCLFINLFPVPSHIEKVVLIIAS